MCPWSWKEAMKWGWVRQAIRLPLWSPGQHFTLETKHHPLLWFEGWKFWFPVSIILSKPGSYDLDRKKQNGLDISDPSHWETLWPRANHTEISLPPWLPPSAGEHREVNGGWCTRAGAQFLTLAPKDTQTHSGLSRVLHSHTLTSWHSSTPGGSETPS